MSLGVDACAHYHVPPLTSPPYICVESDHVGEVESTKVDSLIPLEQRLSHQCWVQYAFSTLSPFPIQSVFLFLFFSWFIFLWALGHVWFLLFS